MEYIIPVSIVVGLFYIFIISPIFAQDALSEVGEAIEKLFMDKKNLPIEEINNQTIVNETTNSIVQEKEEMRSSWKNYTDEYDGFTIEYPSSWIANNYSRIENSYQNATFEYRAYPATHDSYKVLTRISAIDTIVNYDSNYDERIILEKPNMTKYVIDGEKAGSYSYLQKDKESFLQGNEVQEVITIHNGKEYHFTFEEKDVKFFLTDFPKIKKHMLNSIRWLN